MKQFGLLFAALIGLNSCQSIPPTLTGPYQVGTTLKALDNHAGRRLQARLWYPANVDAQQVPERTLSAVQAEAMERSMGIPRWLTGRGLQGRAVAEATWVRGAQPWPVLLFEHGGFSYEGQNWSQMEELASQGWVVIALNHPGESLVVNDTVEQTSARSVWIDEGLWADVMGYQQAHQAEMGETIARGVERVRRATNLDQSKEALFTWGSHPVYQRFIGLIDQRLADITILRQQWTMWFSPGLVNTNKVGILGHSLGGMTAVEASRRDPAFFTAAVSLDTPQFVYHKGENLRLSVPTLFLVGNELIVAGRTLSLEGSHRPWVEASGGLAREEVVPGAAHFNFSDLTYQSWAKFVGLLGSADGSATGRQINRRVTEFFRSSW